jgi:LCP family protein required for cell wall assembly
MVSTRNRRAHPIARTSFLVAAGVLALALSVGSSLAIAGIHIAESKVPTVPTSSDPECATENACLRHVFPCVNQVCNYLILGSDSRAGFNQGQQSQFGNSSQVEGQRSDTIILVHADLPNHKTTVISIPRDLRVEIPGHGIDKINSAFNYGPDVTVQTVERLFGLQINHFVEVNFLGFMRLVNALGGVPICIDRPMIDPLAGLALRHAGCYNLAGAQALAFVRARHVQGDAIPDFSRISRQQQFIRAAMQKLLRPTSLAHLPSLIDALSSNFIRDKGLKLYAIKDLADQLATIGEKDVDFRVVPSIPVTIGGVDYVEPQPHAAAKFFYEIRRGKPLGQLGQGLVLTQISPANISIQLYDASSGGKVDEVRTYLERAGFLVLPTQPAPADRTTTQLLYGPTSRAKEGVVASYLPNVSASFVSTGTPGAAVWLVVGPDFKGID